MTGTASTRTILRRSDHSDRSHFEGSSPGAYTGLSQPGSARFSLFLENENKRLLETWSVAAAAAARAAASRSALPSLPAIGVDAFPEAFAADFAFPADFAIAFSAAFAARLAARWSARAALSAFALLRAGSLAPGFWRRLLASLLGSLRGGRLAATLGEHLAPGG